MKLKVSLGEKDKKIDQLNAKVALLEVKCSIETKSFLKHLHLVAKKLGRSGRKNFKQRCNLRIR